MVDRHYYLRIVTKKNRNILTQFSKKLAAGPGMFWQTDSHETTRSFQKNKIEAMCVYDTYGCIQKFLWASNR